VGTVARGLTGAVPMTTHRVTVTAASIVGDAPLLTDTDAILGHLGINVPDLALAKRCYDALMPLVGFEPYFHTADEFAYKPADSKPGTYLFFCPATEPGGYASQHIGLQHLAFIVRRRSLVHTAHDHVIKTGGTVVHPSAFPAIPGPLLRHVSVRPVRHQA
jgi:catechol 2,3-dioxygenase-like lactoylglutathione lyase family enzyme